MVGMRNFSAPRWAIAGLAALIGVLATAQAYAESAECARLRAAIASAPRGGGGPAAGAASRQRAELAHTSAYARSIGCDNQKFLFFGSDPPAQCGELRGQIARMQASLADLQERAGGGREELVARYNSQCANAQAQPGNIFQALFGIGGRPGSQASRSIPTPCRRTSSNKISRTRSTTKRRAPTFRPAPTQSACAPATAVSSRSPIPA